MTFKQALDRADSVWAYFSCANGASIEFRMTKHQVKQIAHPARLSDVYSPSPEPPDYDGEPDPTCTWSLDADDRLHLHFAT